MAEIIPIGDAADPRIAAYRDIRERDLVGRDGQFIAEGEVVLAVLLGASRHLAVSLLIAERRLPALGRLLDCVPSEAPIYSAPQHVFDAIAGFPVHRGVLAIGRRRVPAPPADLLARLGGPALAVGLIGIANHDNVGGIFRNAAAFGVDAVLLDPATCDPLYRKSIRVSVGGALTVDFARLAAGEDMLDLFERHGFTPLALSPRGAATLDGLKRPERAAILLGTEGVGLPEAILRRVRTVSIPMAKGFDSLNVATTSGIVLHHLACRGR
jgi:tRNA G18 (ribose-2'-O)-methylase SpoU